MASPNSTPISRTGSTLMTGPVASTPSRSPSQPHWNTATTAPNVAPTEPRKPSVAESGTRSDRNTIISRMNASPTTRDR